MKYYEILLLNSLLVAQYTFTTSHIPSIMPNNDTAELCWNMGAAKIKCKKIFLFDQQQQMISSYRTVNKQSIILLTILCKVLILCLPKAQRAHFAIKMSYHYRASLNTIGYYI